MAVLNYLLCRVKLNGFPFKRLTLLFYFNNEIFIARYTQYIYSDFYNNSNNNDNAILVRSRRRVRCGTTATVVTATAVATVQARHN